MSDVPDHETDPAAGRRRRRDRDEEGKARNNRPRDGLGRPLPYGAQGVTRLPEGVRRSAEESLAEAQRLLDEGMPFHAHEVLEDRWKTAPGEERPLWRALAQFAVGLTHAARGNSQGAAALLARATDGLLPYESWPPYRINISGLRQWAADDAHTPATLPPLRTPSSAAGPSNA